MQPASSLIISRSGGVTEVTLNRPEVRNALDEALISDLTKCFEEAADQGCRALILRGAGPSFCAGADLNGMRRAAAFPREQNLEDARALQRLFAALAAFPGVSIASVQGSAMGGGVGLVAVCDIAVADEAAVFAFSEVRLGLAPAVISPYVIEKIGVGAARSLFVTADRFDANKALQIGLVHSVTQGLEEREAEVRRLTLRVLESGPEAIATAKRLIRDVAGRPPAEVAELTAACIADLRAGAEAREGVAAFLEKRPASFAESPDE